MCVSTANTAASPTLAVAIGVVLDSGGKVLIAKRDSKASGDLWEFPGGKLQPGETPQQALIRELQEELNITPLAPTPLITISHNYRDYAVRLFVYTVTKFTGKAQGFEGQPVLWTDIAHLSRYQFPLANRAIINSITLPDEYAILQASNGADFAQQLQRLLAAGVRLIQARVKSLSQNEASRILIPAIEKCRKQGVILLLNHPNAAQFHPDGIHLPATQLSNRPPCRWLAASCHNAQQLHQAEAIGADFALLSPVLATPSHPTATPLGWDKFQQLTATSNIPIFALGGMTAQDKPTAQKLGAQGIAGITTFLHPLLGGRF